MSMALNDNQCQWQWWQTVPVAVRVSVTVTDLCLFQWLSLSLSVSDSVSVSVTQSVSVAASVTVAVSQRQSQRQRRLTVRVDNQKYNELWLMYWLMCSWHDMRRVRDEIGKLTSYNHLRKNCYWPGHSQRQWRHHYMLKTAVYRWRKMNLGSLQQLRLSTFL